MAGITCTVVTPEETALEVKADFVTLPLFDGEIGIGANHSPLIGKLGFGELRLRIGGKVTRYYVDGGFVQVAGNVVSVLTDRAVPAEQVDAGAAENQLSSSLKHKAHTPELMDIRDRQVAQARAQLRVARSS
jgi:F-type H+-transporting ATPase subunit epsilon